MPPLVSIVVPTRNEAGNIDKLVDELDRLVLSGPVQVIFVDDSSDETPEIIAEAAIGSRNEVRLIHRPAHERTGGLSGAVVRGICAASAPWVCVMDGDLQHPPALIEDLYTRARNDKLDLVVASRYLRPGRVGSFSRVRSCVSRLSTTAAKLFFPRALRGLSDPMSGFFLVRREALELDRLRPRGFKILLEILVRTPRLRSGEVPFEFGSRFAGDSKASVREGAHYLRQLVDLRCGETFFHFARFGLVGASGLLVNMVAFAAFAGAAKLHYLGAAVLATQASTAWNFVLTERWVFRGRTSHFGMGSRLALFFTMNNLALGLRGPALVLLVSGLGLGSLLANFITLAALTVVRFGISDSWIWTGRRDRRAATPYRYSIHGIVSVESAVRLPELDHFCVDRLDGRPTIRVHLGNLSRTQSELVTALAFLTRHIRYDERLGRFGFGIEIAVGKSIEILASPLLRLSPHVLYTNVVEPVLRWAFVRKGYALAHGACIAFGEDGYLITARTDTGKTTTVLRMLHDRPGGFLSDDLTLIAPDGRLLAYPKPLTISRHTVQAVKAPLGRRERIALILQSRVHSRSGRRFALVLARMPIPVATVNTIVQLLVPPPKYHIERLVPGVQLARAARLAGLFVIERGAAGESWLAGPEAIETLIRNTDDAYGFPPYPFIEHFLHSGNGRDLRGEEREIIANALSGRPAIVLSSERMDWCERVMALTKGEPLISAPVGEAPSGGGALTLA